MHTIKPIDEDQIVKSSKKSKLFVSIEEHSVIGGLGHLYQKLQVV